MQMTPALELFKKYRGLSVTLAIVALPGVIIIPFPSFVIDFLLAFMFATSIMVLLTTIYIDTPLKFSVFPSLLLVVTLFRLVLNIATTRLILVNAPTKGEDAAGGVIKAFGTFVAGDDPLIGVIMFLILIIVQFVVITKGATRISEVAARFTLDAMPGKQMAIDADLNSGLIEEVEARQRREDISREADFYGAMDGASKFVRGDAVAGLIITAINILGGFLIGWLRYGMDAATALETFTKLTIGDGLVSQIPAFIIAIAAGLIVTRAASTEELGEEFLSQLLTRPGPLAVASGFLMVMAITGLPAVPMVGLSVAAGGLAWLMRDLQSEEEKAKAVEASEEKREPEKVEGLLKVDPMEIEIGYGLIRLVDQNQGGDLLDRVTMIRRQMALELGLVVPPIRIRDNMQLEPNQYVFKMHGVEVDRNFCMADHHLAMDAGLATGRLEGTEATEPAFGLPAVWISEGQRQKAEAMGYTVVDAPTVMATHLTETIKKNASELLTREDVNKLLENLKESSPTVVNELVPEVLKPGEVQKVLQLLLAERVSIRNLSKILEVLSEYAPKTKEPQILSEYVRNALAPIICKDALEEDGKIYCITLDPKLEDAIAAGIQHTEQGSYLSLPPVTLNKIVDVITEALEVLLNSGHNPVVLTSPQIRFHVNKICEGIQHGISVLSYNEIVRGTEVESMGTASMAD